MAMMHVSGTSNRVVSREDDLDHAFAWCRATTGGRDRAVTRADFRLCVVQVGRCWALCGK